MSKVGAILLALALVFALGGSAGAREKPASSKRQGADTEPPRKKEKVFDFTDFSIVGKLRTPQLLYFLGRVRSELERASLRERSFIPEMVRSVDEDGL